MKIAILARVSTAKQDNENQLIQLREFAAKQGWGVVAEYIDVVTGSGKKAREQFDSMMLAASQHKFDLVLFWKLDRFSREGVRKTLVHLQQLDDWKVGWRSFMEPFFDSCGMMRDVVISIMATLAAQERINISDRTKAGLARVRATGKHIGRPRARINIDRVRAMRKAGHSMRGIAKQLNVSAALVCKVVALPTNVPTYPGTA